MLMVDIQTVSWDTGITHQYIFTPIKKRMSVFLSVLPFLDTSLTTFLMFLIRQPPARSDYSYLFLLILFIRRYTRYGGKADAPAKRRDGAK